MYCAPADIDVGMMICPFGQFSDPPDALDTVEE